MCIYRATVSAVSCLVVPAFICIDLLISLVLKINDDDDDDDELKGNLIANIFGTEQVIVTGRPSRWALPVPQIASHSS